MKKIIFKSFLLVSGVVLLSSVVLTFAIMRIRGNSTGSIKASTWSVTRNYSQPGDSIEIYKEGETDSYTLTVESASEVDVKYKIIISNLPTGVEVDLDNTGYESPTNGSLTIEKTNMIINYNDSVKTKTHTITFRATNAASPIANQEINIDVEFRQDI